MNVYSNKVKSFYFSMLTMGGSLSRVISQWKRKQEILKDAENVNYVFIWRTMDTYWII